MSMVVKAFLEKAGDPKGEIRRFSVPTDVTSSFAYINGKVSEVFPSLLRRNFSLFWKDQEGDLVSFSSDTELLEALGFVNDGVFKIFVKEKTSGTQLLHPGVFCDGCSGAIHGVRYKCFECPDYDLCAECEAKGLHPEHEMCKIPTPRPRGHGPMPFMPPPHLRRWMKRYMNRWHNDNGNPQNEQGKAQTDEGPAEKEPQKEKTDQDNEEETTPEEEYLLNVGQDVQAILNPFGINVDVDIEHHGRRHGCPKPGPYFIGRGCCRGRGPWHRGRGFGAGGCGRGGCGFHCGAGFGCRWRGAGCPWQRFQQENTSGENEETKKSEQGPQAKDAETECGFGGCGFHCGRGFGRRGARCPWRQMFQQENATDENEETMESDEAQAKDAENGWGNGGWGFHCGRGFGRRRGRCPWRQMFQQGNGTGENEETMESDQTQTKDAETEKESSSTASGPMNDANSKTETDGEPVTVKQRNGSDDEWTMLNDAFRRNAVIQPRSPLEPASVPLHPDAKINDALKEMLAMGFTNEGGWLTSLLEAKNGDISQVLDSINPQRSLNGGSMA